MTSGLRFSSTFMRRQWDQIVGDRVLTEKELMGVINAVENWLENPPNPDKVVFIVQDYKILTNFIQQGVNARKFPSMWPQYLASAKTGFLKYESYRSTLPKTKPTTTTIRQTSEQRSKPAKRPSWPPCCQRELTLIRKQLKVFAIVDVISLTADTSKVGKSSGTLKRPFYLLEPSGLASAWGLANMSIGTLIPIAAKSAELHATLHSEDDIYLEQWWNRLAQQLRAFG